MKKIYVEPSMAIEKFQVEDIITTSTPDAGVVTVTQVAPTSGSGVTDVTYASFFAAE
jgi:hypothetical protein